MHLWLELNAYFLTVAVRIARASSDQRPTKKPRHSVSAFLCDRPWTGSSRS